uniref:HEAT repeat domain-containing protein n=1 Tax=Desulfosediminicola ganghwensis TaxID=2569540 RepID=UPI0010ABEFB2|nr:hypothetical protein [Desulfosediminicola ganghwensis]
MQNTSNTVELQFPGRPEDLLRFQVNLLALAEKHYDTLHDEEWIENLPQYQLQLYRAGYNEFSHYLLQTLGDVCVCPTAEYREKALFVLTVFLGNAIEEADDELLQALSWIFLRWLHLERELLCCSEHVCSLLPIIPEKLLARGMFAQFTVWLELLQKISNGQLERPPAVQALIGRLNNALLGRFLDHKINLKVINEGQPDSESVFLVKYFADGGASMLINELYQSPDKKRRLALIEILSQLGEGLAVKLLEQLGEGASWYMVRNALKVISHFDCSKHLELVLPFLKYPDLRVQQQVIDIICGLEEQRVDLLIDALTTCHDRLKTRLVEILSQLNTPQIEHTLIRLLETRDTIEQWSRDHLLIAICEALRGYPTIRVSETLKHLISEREQEKRLGDPVVSAARKTVEQLSAL